MTAPASDDTAPADPTRARLDALAQLFESLAEKPWSYDFFAVIRRFETLRPDAPRFGRALRPTQEVIRLGQEPELDFAPAALASFRHHTSGAPRMGVRFFGLLGPHGPMPLHLTEYVREREHQHNDPTAARFLDIFHHRMLSLFYRAWAQAQPVVQRDRREDDRFAAWLGATLGLGRATSMRDAIPDDAKLYQASLLASRSRHPEGLAKVLSQYFRVPVQIEQHVPHFLTLPMEDRSRLGYARNRVERSRSAPAQLGRSVNAGAKVWDRQYKFRVALGPLSLAQYLSFLPGGRAWPQLRDWVQLYAGLELTWDVQLALHENEVPPPRLGRGVRLGLTSWAGARRKKTSAAGDRRDLHLRPATSFLLRSQGARAQHG